MSFFKKGKRQSFSSFPSDPHPVIAPKETEMANRSEFEIPAAILTASLVARSELTGHELEKFAFHIHRFLVDAMKRDVEQKERS